MESGGEEKEGERTMRKLTERARSDFLPQPVLASDSEVHSARRLIGRGGQLCMGGLKGSGVSRALREGLLYKRKAVASDGNQVVC